MLDHSEPDVPVEVLLHFFLPVVGHRDGRVDRDRFRPFLEGDVEGGACQLLKGLVLTGVERAAGVVLFYPGLKSRPVLVSGGIRQFVW